MKSSIDFVVLSIIVFGLFEFVTLLLFWLLGDTAYIPTWDSIIQVISKSANRFRLIISHSCQDL